MGRWPANVALDPTTARLLDQQTGELPGGGPRIHQENEPNGFMADRQSFRQDVGKAYPADSGGASRFFYTAKASPAERITVQVRTVVLLSCGTTTS